MTTDKIDDLATKPAEEPKYFTHCSDHVVGWRGEVIEPMRVVDVKLNPDYRLPIQPAVAEESAEEPADRTRDYSLRDLVLEKSIKIAGVGVIGGVIGAAGGASISYIQQRDVIYGSIIGGLLCASLGIFMQLDGRLD